MLTEVRTQRQTKGGGECSGSQRPRDARTTDAGEIGVDFPRVPRSNLPTPWIPTSESRNHDSQCLLFEVGLSVPAALVLLSVA